MERLVLSGVLLPLILKVRDVALSDNMGYRIFNEMEQHEGMCLTVMQRHGDRQPIPFLSPNCPENNAAWRWSLLSRNRLMNIHARRCLGVRKLGVDEVVLLAACDEQKDSYLSWTCGANFNLRISNFRLGYQFIYDKWTVVGARVVMKNEQSMKTSSWIVYPSNVTSSRSSICDLPLDDSKLDDNTILTTYGGNRVGVRCVFPFTYKHTEIWSCSVLPDISKHFICAVSSNLDKNLNDWGVCPQNKRGTTTLWLQPPYCDKPCGGGQLILLRKCLFQPCHTHLSKSTGVPCNTDACSGDVLLTIGGSSDIFPVTEVHPTLDHVLFGKCVFPYVYQGTKYQGCISTLQRPHKWCSLTENFDKHKHWGYCLPEFAGSWSSWSGDDSPDSQCSVSCGAGILSRKRSCRFEPCRGIVMKLDGVCNTRPCTVCFKEGEENTILVNTAADGTICIPWFRAPLQAGERYESDWGKYCRRPLATRYQPYCYINDKETGEITWKYCDIPPCGVSFSAPGIAFTVPTHPYDLDKVKYAVGKECQFPFLAANNEIYDRCVSITPGRDWCRTINETSGSDFAYCSRYFVGRWGQWILTNECTKRCGEGNLLSYRICLLPPCKGEGMRVEDEKCNLFPCTFTNPGLDDCFHGVGMLYSGKRSVTITGHRCQSWSSQNPISHGLHPNTNPSGFPALEENYCRNPTPGIRFAPWCYSGRSIGNVKVRWEYCDVVKCPDSRDKIFGIPIQPSLTSMHNRAPKPCNFSYSWPKTFAGNGTKVCHRVTIEDIGEISICSIKMPANNITKAPLQGLQAGEYAVCPKTSEGTTGPWKKWKCSKTCDGGFWLYVRQCIHPPCPVTSKLEKSLSCNTHACLDCFTGAGSNYLGQYATTYKGSSCRKWAKAGKYTELEGNYCRNPKSGAKIPWCYSESSGEEEHCDPPHCNANGTIPYTIPISGYSVTARGCVFPYKDEGESYSTCLRYPEGYFCPVHDIAPALLYKSALGMCPPSYEGTWSVWRDTGFCTEYCGGGKKLYIRECLFPICKGQWLKYGATCNTFPCKWKSKLKKNMDCYMNYGYDYSGNVSTTYTGKKCMNWKSQSTWKHHYTNDYLGKPLDHAFCRNPSPYERFAPWCFTMNSRKRWEYCNVRRCPSVEAEIIPFEPTQVPKPCRFPYHHRGAMTHSCITFFAIEILSMVNMCGTEDNPILTNRSTWGRCIPAHVGIWSPWTLIRTGVTCTMKCGGGQYRYQRRCRYVPCKGPTEKFMGRCNTQPCPSCYQRSDKGVSYAGLMNSTYNGIPCVKREIEGVSTDKCRNFDNSHHISPWCDVDISGKKIPVPCGLRHCEKDGDVVGILTTSRATKFCKFPFRYKGKLFHSCIRIRLRLGMWCSSDAQREKLIKCYESYQGVWTSWKRTSCTEPCGGGVSVYARYCRYAPCEGPSTVKMGKCNTKPCDDTRDCYLVSNGGETYIGPINVSMSSKQCVKWHHWWQTSYPAAGLEGSKCRNPGGVEPRPWCYINEAHAELCNVPPCPKKWSSLSAQPIFVKIQMQPELSLPCIFPFEYKKKKYSSCISLATPKNQRPPPKKWCATVAKMNLNQPDPDISREFGYCDDKYIGTWMTWSGSKKFCSADCYIFLKRSCLLAPCSGHNIRVTAERCGDPPCQSLTWMEWNQWSACSSCIKVSVQVRKREDTHRESRIGTCSSVEESKYSGTCHVATNAASPGEIRSLVQSYMAGFQSSVERASNPNHVAILINFFFFYTLP